MFKSFYTANWHSQPSVGEWFRIGTGIYQCHFKFKYFVLATRK